MAMLAYVEPDVRNVRLELVAPAGAATLTIVRAGPSGETVSVRTYDAKAVVPGPVIARDFEAPIGVPILYTATTYTAAGAAQTPAQTVTVTIPSEGCSDTWLTDLVRAGNTQQIVMESLPELSYPVSATVHDVLSRRAPIVTSDIAHTPAFELSFLTASDEERLRARFTLGNGIPVLLRTPPEDGIGNLYMSVLEFAEQRVVTPATVTDRRFVVRGRQVNRPDPVLYSPQPPQSYLNVRDTFATYADLRAQRANYDALAYDWTGSSASDVFPWPPSDV